MKNEQNINTFPESDDTEDIDLLLDDFKTALKMNITSLICLIVNFISSDNKIKVVILFFYYHLLAH